MRKTVFCRRLPAPRLLNLRGIFSRLNAVGSQLSDICQLSDGALLLDWADGARQLVSLEPYDRDFYGGEYVCLRNSGHGAAAGNRALRGLNTALFKRISGLFESYGALSVAALEQKDLGSVPGAVFRSFLVAPSLSGRAKSVSFDAAKCAALYIGDEECWFDVANHIEPFCLSYAAPSSETFNPFGASRAGALSSAFKYRSEKSVFYPLRDRDMLSGWDGLSKAAACAGKAAGKNDAIIVDSGCLAQTCGVNSSGIADDLRAKGGGFVLLTTPVSRAAQPVIGAGGGKGAAAPGNSVDFFNAKDDFFRSELRAICKSVGLTVNSFCFPDYSRERFPSYGRARLRVVFSSARNSGAVRGILAAENSAVVLCDACFGPGQVLSLAKRLASAAGGRRKTFRGLEVLFPGASERIAAVRRALNGRRAAVVLDINEFHLAVANWAPGLRQAVLDAGFYQGAEFEDAPLETSSRLKAVSGDTGIGLDFFLLSPRGLLPGVRREITRILKSVFPGASARVFNAEADLYDALKISGVRGVFSAYSFDDRVLACGKLPLDLECVGAGVLNALNGYETLSRKMSAGLFNGGKP